MFRHIIVIGLRNIRKYWKYALINIAGLTIGLVSFIFIIIGYQSFRITSFNPAHELRYE